MSEYFSNDWRKLDSIIIESNSILLSTHVNSDGDGLGSEIAMYYYLKSLGKDCRIINPSPFTEMYRVINPDDIVESYSKDKDDWMVYVVDNQPNLICPDCFKLVQEAKEDFKEEGDVEIN